MYSTILENIVLTKLYCITVVQLRYSNAASLHCNQLQLLRTVFYNQAVGVFQPYWKYQDVKKIFKNYMQTRFD